MNDVHRDHWLVRPRTIRGLWIAGSVVLGLTLLAEVVMPIEGTFVADDWFGFAAVFGFAVCVGLVLVAKVVGALLKRPQGYYDD